MMSESKKNSKIEPIFISDEMLEEDNFDSKLRDKMIEDAEEIEKALETDPKLDGIEAPAGMLDSITASLKNQGYWEDEEASEVSVGQKEELTEIDAAEDEDILEQQEIMRKAAGAEGLSDDEIYQMLSPDDRAALTLGRRLNRRKKWQGPLIKVACIIVVLGGVLGASITGDASREYLIGIWNSIVSEGLSINIDNDKSLKTTDNELEVFYDIKKHLDIKPLQLLYKPQGLVYDNYSMSTVTRSAQMYYLYNDTITNVFMYKGDESQANARTFDGKKIDSYDINIGFTTVEVSVIENPETGEKSYIAQMVYNNTHYSISSIMDRNEFDKMIQYISF